MITTITAPAPARSPPPPGIEPITGPGGQTWLPTFDWSQTKLLLSKVNSKTRVLLTNLGWCSARLSRLGCCFVTNFTGVCSFNRFLKWKSNNQLEPYLYKQLWEDFIFKIASFRHSLRYWIFLSYHLFSLQPVINAFNLLPSKAGPVLPLLSMF